VNAITLFSQSILSSNLSPLTNFTNMTLHFDSFVLFSHYQNNIFSMEITGRVIQLLPLVTGQGRNGEWRKQEFVIEIAEGQFPKKVCISLWGDKINQAALAENETVKVSFDLESREYNGRWYTEVKAWRVDKQNGNEAVHTSSPQVPNESSSASFTATQPEDDLPF